MGKLCCNCESQDPCFICESNYTDKSDFSFSIFGMDVVDTLPEKLPGAEYSEIDSRYKEGCFKLSVETLLRNYVELPWSDPQVVIVPNGHCGSFLFHDGSCQYLCQQCNCDTVYDISSPCEPIQNKFNEKSYKSATCWKVFQQQLISYSLRVECCDSIGDQIRYTLDITYMAVRLGTQRSKINHRYREFTVDCIYEESGDFPDAIIEYGDWIYPPELGGEEMELEDPCIPCDFSTYTLSPCDPTESDCESTELVYDGFYVDSIFHCGFGQVCGQIFLSGSTCNASSTTASTLLASYPVTDDTSCHASESKVCVEQLSVGLPFSLYSVSYQSDCIKCSEVGSTVSLTKVYNTTPNPDGLNQVTLRTAVTGTECSLPELKITIPPSLTLNLS